MAFQSLYPFIPKEELPLIHKGHRYQLWISSPVEPMLVAEFTAHDNKIAQRSVRDILAVKLGHGETDDEAKARLFEAYNSRSIKLINIDTMEEIHIRKSHARMKDIMKLAHLS
jgi:hypothetical protein